MQHPTAASLLMETFSWKATITAFIKSASKEAIPRAIPSAFRERALAVARRLWARPVSRHQSCHGLAVCRRAWIAGAKARRCAACLTAHCTGHALSIGIIITVVLLARVAVPPRTLKIAAAAILFGFGLFRLLRSRHP